MARRSRDKLVIFLTLERPPRGRPLWLCRSHSSQCRDSSGAAPRPLSRPTFAHRPLSRPTFADRSLSRPTCVAWVRLIPACKRVGAVRLWWCLSGSSHRLVSDFVGPARRRYGQAPRGTRTRMGPGRSSSATSCWQPGPLRGGTRRCRPATLAHPPSDGRWDRAGGGDASPQCSHTGRGGGTTLFSRARTACRPADPFLPPAPPTPSSHPPRRPVRFTRPADPSLHLEPLS